MISPLSRTGTDTIGGILRLRSETEGEAPFLTFEDPNGAVESISYGEAFDRASRVASMLARMGVGRGDRVNLHLANCPEFLDCLFGAALLGAVVVPTNPLSTADELAFMVGHSGCSLTVTQPDLVETVTRVQDHVGRIDIVVVRTDEPVHGAILFNDATLQRTSRSAATTQPSDVVSIMYTSGTTSRPKGVMVSNAAYVHVGEVVAEHLRLRPADCQLVVLPLFHGNAQFYSTMSSLVSGASIALMHRFSASRWGSQVARYRCTTASVFAAPIRMILAQPESPDEKKNDLRTVLFAQNITAEQLDSFERRFGCSLVQLYGMTETVAPPTMNPVYGERRNMGIGRPLLWARVRIVDGAGKDVPVGQTGKLLVHGEPGQTIMSGYLDDPESTGRALEGQWLHTGDHVRADGDGYLYFVDRGKDLIKRAGENVATGEVERVVNDHPAVYESSAIGIPDPVRDETIKVFVVLLEGQQATAAEIREWCATRLARFKVPEFVAFVEDLPRTSVGKIQKHVLRDWHEAGTSVSKEP